MHDVKLLEATIKAIVVDRPDPDSHPQNLCLDKGYDGRTARVAAEAARYIPQIRRKGEEKVDTRGKKRYPARRWVVERTLAWLQTCRAILIRLRQEGVELSWLAPARLRLALVQAPTPAPRGDGDVTYFPAWPRRS